MYNILRNKCVSWQRHGAMKGQVQRVHLSYQEHLCFEEWNPVKKSELSLTEYSTSICAPYHPLYVGQG